MATKKDKITGMKDDLDVVSIVKAFEAFKNAVQLLSDSADAMVVELDFETSLNTKKHYSFKQDDMLTLSGISFHEDTKKLMFSVPEGITDKVFYMEETELVQVLTEVSGKEEKHSLDTHVKGLFGIYFPTELKVSSITALQALVKNNPPLIAILNNGEQFLADNDKQAQRGKAYASIANYGRY